MRLLALTLALAALVPSPSRAQEEDARVLFERGSAAVEAGRFADARVDLERSLALDARAATAFNLVVALRGMGELVDAGPVCDGLRAERYGPLSEEQREEAAGLCSDARAGIAHLTVRVLGEATIEIFVDGRSLGEAEPGAVLEETLDPGAHVVTHVVAGRQRVDRTVDFERGGRLVLELSAAAPASAGPDLGLVIGLSAGGAAVLVIAIVIAVVLTGPSPAPVTGDFPVTSTLISF